MLPSRLTAIDETTRSNHRFLGADDRCLYFSEYFTGKGYEGGATNQLIFNLKTPPSSRPGRLHYKEKAISTAAAQLRLVMTQSSAESITWVPIPPSKALGDPEYDDRMTRVLNRAFDGYDVDVRLLLHQTKSTNADHAAGDRLTLEALYQILDLDRELLASKELHKRVVLFDDVLTSGKHFKCCKRRLLEAAPGGTEIIGVFLARRILADPPKVPVT